MGWQDDPLPGFQAEALAYAADGTVLKGVQPRNNWIPVTGRATKAASPHGNQNGEVDVYLEAAANPQFFGPAADRFRATPLGDVRTAGDRPLFTLAAAGLYLLDPALTGLISDLELVAGLVAEPAVD